MHRLRRREEDRPLQRDSLGPSPDFGGLEAHSQPLEALTFPLGVSCPPAQWERERARTAERLDLFFVCHYYNYCYHVTTVFFKIIPIGDFTTSSQSSNEVSQKGLLSPFEPKRKARPRRGDP